MTFTYDYISKSYSSELFPAMTNALNKLNKNRRRSVKVAASDLKGSSAKGALIYCNESAPDPSTLKDSWIQKFWNSTSPEANIKSCIAFLNSSEITITQKYYSRIIMSDVSGGNAYLAIFYQVQE